MAVSEKVDWCSQCGKDRLFRRHEPEHWIHLVLTVVTGGWWLLVWLAATVFRGPFRCEGCGLAYQVPKAPRSVWLLPSVAVAFALFVAGVGAGRFLWQSSDTSDPPGIYSVNPGSPQTRGGLVPATPTCLHASELRRAFERDHRESEIRFGTERLTISGDVRYVPPTRRGGQAWLVFVDAANEPIAQCLIPEDAHERFESRFGEQPTRANIRCHFLRYSPDGSLTLHRPELVVD